MTERNQPPTPDRLVALLDEGNDEAAATSLERLAEADTDARKRTLRALRDAAEDRPDRFEGLAPALAPFVTDDDRAVRLTTAKLFVALARSAPAVALPVADALAARLADESEFYYVRARCAEALGYVAVESPERIADPETLADLRVGLAFDEPEVKAKLAKALAHVALGDPSRLRHRVDALVEHLDDGDELVRYYLCTALVVIGCEHSEALVEATDALRERLTDERPHVRGRAAEALGLVAGSGAGVEPGPAVDECDAGDEAPQFLTDRLRFLRQRLDGVGTGAGPGAVGTVASVRDGTEAAVAEMTSPDEGACPHCGLDLPDAGPPMCPRCGTPR
jgi:hypothetical protein